MQKLFYQPKDHWFGDCMPFGRGGKFYVFHQRDTRNPKPLREGQPFGWSLAVTEDFVTYEDYGEVLKRGEYEAQDQYIYAGSVFEGEGRFHAFYTGFNREYESQGKPSQVLMHAVSENLIDWVKTKDEVRFSPQPGYDPNDWRDPFVFWNEEAQEYWLILGARKKNGRKEINGSNVYFTSKDLEDWEFQGDFWAPGIFTMHEMPDLFRIGEWWYLLNSEYSHRKKIVYRMSRSLKGPWMAPDDDGFDGRAYYAGRTFEEGGKRILFGWVPTKEGDDDRNQFQWGGALLPHEVYQRKDGTLGVRPLESIWNAFGGEEDIRTQCRLKTVDSRAEMVLARDCGDLFRFEAEVILGEGTREFAVRLYENEETGEAYEYQFYVGENRMVFDKAPNCPWPQCMNMGLERPIRLEAGRSYRIQVIVDDTIGVLYVDGIALSVRMYRKPGGSLAVHVTDGELTVKQASIARGLY